MKNNNKKVAVIVPVYKVERNLVENCIKSIIEQSYSNLEIIVVDDGNLDDDYCQFLGSLKEMDKRISLIKHEQNKGLYAARITGVEHSNSDYICFVDADDYIGVDWIRLLVKKANQEHSDIVMGGTINEDVNHWKYVFNHCFSICTQSSKNGREIFEYLLEDCGLNFLIHTVWNKLYTRELWEKALSDLKRIDTHLVMTEDIMFSFVLFYYAKKMSFSNHDGYFYYRNAQSSTVGIYGEEKCIKNLRDIEKVFNTVEAFMKDKGVFEKNKKCFVEWKNRYSRWWSYTVSNVCKEIDADRANALKNYFLKIFDKTEFQNSVDADGYFDQAKTEWNPNLEEMKKKICSSDIKVVSFDIFDTLITRPFLYPEDLFFVAVNELDNKDYDCSMLIKYRKLSEEYARKQQHILNPEYEDITLTEIYSVMSSKYDISKEVCRKLMKKEVELEVKYSTVRQTGKDLFELALALNKDVYITSDMYLERKDIERILEKNCYSGYKELLLSSEQRALKATGSLFTKLIDKSEMEPNAIVHIGDNWNADVVAPRNKRINSIFIPKTKDILLNYLGDQYTGEAFGRALNNEESVVDYSKFFNSFTVRCICAVTANILYDNPFVSFNEYSDYNGDPYTLGVMALGPHMLGICSWLISMADNYNSERIHFSSRDGFYLKRVFDFINNRCNLGLKTNYLHISRKSFIPIEIRTRKDVCKIAESCSLYANTPLTIINRYKKLLKDLDAETIEQYNSYGIELDKRFSNEDEFLYFLDKLASIQFSQNNATKEFELCKKYLIDNEVEDNDLIFDLGYSGKLHNDIVRCVETNPIGAYLSKDGYNALKRMSDNKLRISSYYSFTPSMQGIINEYILSDRAPSCIGYYNHNNKIEVQYEEKMDDYIGDYVVNEINRGAYTFVERIIDVFSDNLELMYMTPMDGSLLYERFLISPKLFDRSMFDFCLIEDEYYGGIKERPLNEIWNWQINDRKLEKNPEIKYVDRVIEKEVPVEVIPDNLEWEVYKKQVIGRNKIVKALYWLSVNPKFFTKRVKELGRK